MSKENVKIIKTFLVKLNVTILDRLKIIGVL